MDEREEVLILIYKKFYFKKAKTNKIKHIYNGLCFNSIEQWTCLKFQDNIAGNMVNVYNGIEMGSY